jgi:hypothetical protein
MKSISSQDHQALQLQPLLRLVLAVSLVFLIVLLGVAAIQRAFSEFLTQLILTSIGFAAGALLMSVQISALQKRSTMVVVGLLAIALSQVSFLGLVWTGWRVHSWLWRVWWVTMVPSVFMTHLLILRTNLEYRWGIIEWGTAISVPWAGICMLLLGFRHDFFANLSPFWLWMGGIPSAGTILGSFYLYFRWLLGKAGPNVVAKRAIVAGTLMSHLVIALAAFYVGRATVSQQHVSPREIVEQSDEAVQQLEDDAYAVQIAVSTSMASTYLVDRLPFITNNDVAQIQPMLKPGDIILVRRNWKLSNPFLQGFWTHSALYTGTIEDLERLGILEQPAVQKHIETYQRPAADGTPYTVIEALGEGVIFNPLPRALFADYAVVLRPRLTEGQIAEALVRAFSYVGTPYDFNFDFATTDKLVCTQLVYLTFEGMLHFDLRDVLGRTTLPPLDIARKYARERDHADQQLDFVLFLDAVPEQHTVMLASEETFRETIHRPRALTEQ